MYGRPLVENHPMSEEIGLSDEQATQWAALRRSRGGGFPGPLSAAGGQATPVPSGGGGAGAGGGGSGCLKDRGVARSSSSVRVPGQDSWEPGSGGCREAKGSWYGGRERVGTPRAHRGGAGTWSLHGGARCPRPSPTRDRGQSRRVSRGSGLAGPGRVGFGGAEAFRSWPSLAAR